MKRRLVTLLRIVKTEALIIFFISVMTSWGMKDTQSTETIIKAELELNAESGQGTEAKSDVIQSSDSSTTNSLET